MHEFMISKKASGGGSADDLNPAVINSGDSSFGFYGALRNTQMTVPSISGNPTMTGTGLATLWGLTEGNVINDTVDWLKFSFNGKLCYIPKKPIRSNVSWGAIYAAGLAYGLRYGGGNGENPYPTGTPVNQGAKSCLIRDLSIGTTNITVRPSLMRRIATTPPSGAVSATETMDLLLRCCTERDRNWGAGKTWSYLNEMFGSDSIAKAAYYSWCQDLAVDGGDGRTMLPISAGYMTATSTGTHRAAASGAGSQYGWRPVLLQV